MSGALVDKFSPVVHSSHRRVMTLTASLFAKFILMMCAAAIALQAMRAERFFVVRFC
jgi:hypothetical protein